METRYEYLGLETKNNKAIIYFVKIKINITRVSLGCGVL